MTHTVLFLPIHTLPPARSPCFTLFNKLSGHCRSNSLLFSYGTPISFCLFFSPCTLVLHCRRELPTHSRRIENNGGNGPWRCQPALRTTATAVRAVARDYRSARARGHVWPGLSRARSLLRWLCAALPPADADARLQTSCWKRQPAGAPSCRCIACSPVHAPTGSSVRHNARGGCSPSGWRACIARQPERTPAAGAGLLPFVRARFSRRATNTPPWTARAPRARRTRAVCGLISNFVCTSRGMDVRARLFLSHWQTSVQVVRAR